MNSTEGNKVDVSLTADELDRLTRDGHLQLDAEFGLDGNLETLTITVR